MTKKSTERLIQDLKLEYSGINQKLTLAKFALKTLSLDEKEKWYLTCQISAMEDYANAVIKRAEYAKYKHENRFIYKDSELSPEIKKSIDEMLGVEE